MTPLKLSSILLGATALTLPFGITAHAQQTQQGQQGQQATAEQGTELGACERLLRLVEEAGDEQLLAEFEEAPQIAERRDIEECTLVIEQIEQAGGISEEAVAADRGSQFLTDRDSFRASERLTETVEIEQQAVVEGEVLVRQPIPEIGIEESGPEVDVTPGPVGVAIEEQPAEIRIRQAPANVRVEIPEPVITIEQPAPEIVLHMPPPGVSLERQLPQVSVTTPDPTVSVAQAEPEVTAEVDARFVNEDEYAQIQQSDEPLVATTTERLDAAGNPVDEQKTAEVTVRKGEADVAIQETEQQPDVRFEGAEPRIVFEQADPNVDFAFADSAQVQVENTGEPTVRIERGGEQQTAEGQQGQQQAMQDQQGQQQQAMQDQQGDDVTALTQDQVSAEQLSAEETNRLLAMPEDSALGEPQPMDVQAGDLSGADIETVNGEDVGEIAEITSNGDQLFAVIEHGGFLGIGEDQIAVPLDRIAMRGDQVILLGLSEQELEQMANHDFQADQAFSANETVEIGSVE